MDLLIMCALSLFTIAEDNTGFQAVYLAGIIPAILVVLTSVVGVIVGVVIWRRKRQQK